MMIAVLLLYLDAKILANRVYFRRRLVLEALVVSEPFEASW
jgi:hypothetical protein